MDYINNISKHLIFLRIASEEIKFKNNKIYIKTKIVMKIKFQKIKYFLL